MKGLPIQNEGRISLNTPCNVAWSRGSDRGGVTTLSRDLPGKGTTGKGEVEMALRKAQWGLVLALAVVAIIATGCGGSSSSAAPAAVAGGQIPKSELPSGGSGSGDASSVSTSTVPLAQQSPATAFFTALGVFQSCLSGLGTKFIGVPNKKDAGQAVDNPTYIKNLETCADRSQILQALDTANNADNKLTPAQVEVENKGYLKWRQCMISDGWTIPTPKPASNGLLFTFGNSSGSDEPQMTPPPGESLLSSNDMQACLNQVDPSGS